MNNEGIPLRGMDLISSKSESVAFHHSVEILIRKRRKLFLNFSDLPDAGWTAEGGVVLFDVGKERVHLREGLHHLLKPRGAVERLFHFQQLPFGALDIVAHTLPGDAFLFGDLGQGKVVVVIQVDDLALFIGQHRPVMVQKDGYVQIFLCHFDPPFPINRTV